MKTVAKVFVLKSLLQKLLSFLAATAEEPAAIIAAQTGGQMFATYKDKIAKIILAKKELSTNEP